MLSTRDITVRLGDPDRSYRIRYNTATTLYTVDKPSQYYPDLSQTDIQNVLSCIQLKNTEVRIGGKKKRATRKSKKTRNARR